MFVVSDADILCPLSSLAFQMATAVAGHPLCSLTVRMTVMEISHT
jgi:hypothetical protein